MYQKHQGKFVERKVGILWRIHFVINTVSLKTIFERRKRKKDKDQFDTHDILYIDMCINVKRGCTEDR